MRAHFTIKFSVDLDAIPGWGHKVEDWIRLATEGVMRQSHYNVSYEVVEIVEERNYVGNHSKTIR